MMRGLNYVQDTTTRQETRVDGGDISVIQDSGRRLLYQYSGIPNEEMDDHIETIRTMALKVCPYPCIKMYRFMDISIATLPIYPEILDRTKNGDKFLDLGCCLGQEIRQLVFDGTPSKNTYGSDLYGGYFPVGYKLFKDQDRLQTTFIAADIFDNTSKLTELEGKINIIYTGAFFHLFGLEEQKKIAARVVQLLAPRPGSMVCGQQSGNEKPGEYGRKGDTSGRKSFRHNPQSWKELWDHVGEITGSKWDVEADLDSPEFALQTPEGQKQTEKGPQGLRFVVKRL
ncbi:hypothetical protein V8E51_016499 [Hyaloscypha variabilis]